MENKSESSIIIGVDDKVSYPKAFVLGLQHVLAMDLYIAPIIIAGLLSLSAENTSFFVQMCFLATGLATLI
ncbi:purine permease, partial [Butyricicoccus sp. 1XD8-22]